LLRQIIQRTLIIFALGIFLNGFPHFHWASIRIPGVLQRIAICYFFGSLFFLFTSVPVQIATAVALLFLYHGIMLHAPIPGFHVGDLSKEGNLAAYVDRRFLGAHMYRPVYDPEGILSTIPAISSVLFGNLAGVWLRAKMTLSQKINGLVQAGCVLLLVGVKWNHFFPINKALWSSSFVAVTT